MIKEAATADVNAGNAFPGYLKMMIEDGDYCAQQVFHVDETDFFGEKCQQIHTCLLTKNVWRGRDY